jgi:integrase
VRDHFLRHTHGSQLIAAGWDVAAVAARLGDSIQTVMTTYAHEFDAKRREGEQREQLAALAPMAAPGGTERAVRAVAAASAGPS